MFNSNTESSDYDESYNNFYYDEESEVSKAESSKISNYYGDSPSTHPISDSEEEYVYSDGEGAHDVSLINQITNKSRIYIHSSCIYARRMSDIEIELPLADIDLQLIDHIRLLLVLRDIPISSNKSRENELFKEKFKINY
ncbi:hypothetical protein U3516DRAFT_768970 [Neocallimastix sp. 'constans']